MPLVYITKWVLTRGILVASGKVTTPRGCHRARIYANIPATIAGARRGAVLFLDREAFLKLQDAQADAEKRFTLALEQQRQSLARLEQEVLRLGRGELLVHEVGAMIGNCQAFPEEVHSDPEPDVDPSRPPKEGPSMPSPSVDTTFGINPQSLAVLALMSAEYVDLRDPPKTYPWYNGRENGIAIVLSSKVRCRIILIVESGRSDRVTVEYWDQAMKPLNAPTIHDREKNIETVLRAEYKTDKISRAAGLATSLIQEYLES